MGENQKQELDFTSMKIYKIVELTAKASLKKLDATREENKQKSDKIIEQACKIYPDLMSFVGTDSYKSYLSSISNQSGSLIVRPLGKHGYYLLPETTVLEDVKQEDEVQAEEVIVKIESERKEKEKLLYPILKTWLQEQGYRTKDTSTQKVMGKWGNPDLTGIKVEDNIVATDVEIVTIEAKISSDNWEYNFFEAVSHRRFANRVYFAFAHPLDLVKQLPSALRYYSELYDVGVLVVGMSKDDFDKFKKGQVEKIEYDSTDTYELYSAKYFNLPTKFQKAYFKAIGINENRDLYLWGDEALSKE